MPDTFAAGLKDWLGFYEVLAESSATLTGLMFVAATVGARHLTAVTLPIVRPLITPTLGYLLSTLVLSATLCIPTQTRPGLAAELGVFGLIGLCQQGALLRAMRRLRRQIPLEWRHWVWQIVLPPVSYCGVFAASAGLWAGRPWALNVLGFAVLLLVLIGVINAWETTLRSMTISTEDEAALEKNGASWPTKGKSK